jgi:hypothetical protein
VENIEELSETFPFVDMHVRRMSPKEENVNEATEPPLID